MNYDNVTFNEMRDASLKIWSMFDEIEQRSWSVEVVVMELMKQVGDLSKVIMNYENYYLPDRKSRCDYHSDIGSIGNELADILHQIIRIADYYDVDLAKSHFLARDGEYRYIQRYMSKTSEAE